jgi:hypothetical protein
VLNKEFPYIPHSWLGLYSEWSMSPHWPDPFTPAQIGLHTDSAEFSGHFLMFPRSIILQFHQPPQDTLHPVRGYI